MMSNVGVRAHEGITRMCQENHKVITKVSQVRVMYCNQLLIS